MPLPITSPQRTFYSQRRDGRPFVNCLPYSICPVLAWMGYEVPADYGMTLRTASGVAVAEGRGTSHADMRRGLAKLLPAALEELSPGPGVAATPPALVFAGVTDAELLDSVLPRAKKPNRGSVVSVICRMELLPKHLRRNVGYTWSGLHALTFYQRKKAPDGSYSVYLSDPMGRTYRGYVGEWAQWADLSKAVKRNDAGLIRIISGRYGSAV